jgi:hypothetical protein
MEAITPWPLITNNDAERATRMIKELYVDKVVYIESLSRPVDRSELVSGQYSFHGTRPALCVGSKLAVDLRMIKPVDPCEPPFKLMDIPHWTEDVLDMIPIEDVIVERAMDDYETTVDVVVVDAKRMIHKKMSPVTPTEYMILELDRYIALSGCKYVPPLLAVTQDTRVQGWPDSILNPTHVYYQ